MPAPASRSAVVREGKLFVAVSLPTVLQIIQWCLPFRAAGLPGFAVVLLSLDYFSSGLIFRACGQ